MKIKCRLNIYYLLILMMIYYIIYKVDRDIRLFLFFRYIFFLVGWFFDVLFRLRS